MILASLLFGIGGFYETASAEVSSEKRLSHSIAPLVGYNPTYRLFLGAGYFLETNKFQWKNIGVISTTEAYRIEQDIRYEFVENWYVNPFGKFDQGFVPNYGRGSDTQRNVRTDSYGRLANARVLFSRKWNTKWEGSFGYSVLDWQNDRFEGSEENSVHSETYHSFLSLWKLDRRVGEFGSVFKVGSEIGVHTEAFFKWNVTYHYLWDLGSKLTIASKTKVGTVFGDSKFHSDFTLGGGDELRGYQENRFRGPGVYLQMLEFHFPIYGPLSGLGFTDAGGIYGGLRDFSGGPRASAGGGLRYRLPPDRIEQIRLDVGAGADQWGLFLAFGRSI